MCWTNREQKDGPWPLRGHKPSVRGGTTEQGMGKRQQMTGWGVSWHWSLWPRWACAGLPDNTAAEGQQAKPHFTGSCLTGSASPQAGPQATEQQGQRRKGNMVKACMGWHGPGQANWSFCHQGINASWELSDMDNLSITRYKTLLSLGGRINRYKK